MSTTFEVIYEDDKTTIVFPKEFRGVSWSEDFGKIQRLIEEARFNTLIIDMSQTIWADPVPMLSMLISLKYYKKDDNRIDFIIPDVNEAIKGDPHSAFLVFLLQEGFIDILEEMKASLFIRKSASTVVRTEYSELSSFNVSDSHLNYKNCHLLPARILDVEGYKDGDDDEIYNKNIKELVSELLHEINSVMRSNIVPNYAADTMYMEIYQILFETIHNVGRHAYPEENNKYAGIYIRYRCGVNNAAISITDIANIKELAKKEETGSPKLLAEYIHNSEGFLEVMIIDSGIGLKESLITKLITNPHGRPYHSPVCGYYQVVFVEGVPGRERNDMSDSGGLYLIGQMLSIENNYIHSHDANLWEGFDTPILKDKPNLSHSDYRKSDEKCNPNEDCVHGLSWNFRLSWKNNSIRSQMSDVQYFNKDFNKGDARHHPVYRAFREDRIVKSEYQSTFYVDQRDRSWSGKTFIESNDLKFSHYYWLPDERNTKNNITKSLIEYLLKLEFCTYYSNEKVSNKFCTTIRRGSPSPSQDWFYGKFKECSTNTDIAEKVININTEFRVLREAVEVIKKIFTQYLKDPLVIGNKRTLIIMDIPSYEMIVYKNSLAGMAIGKMGLIKRFSDIFSSLIICSRHYEVIAFSVEQRDKQKKVLKINNSIAKCFVECADQNLSIANSALWLRSHDSIRFWETLKRENRESTYYTNARIKWTPPVEEINGYLHLDNVLGHDKLFDYIKLAIDRTLGYFLEKNAVFIANDFSVQHLVDMCNIMLENTTTTAKRPKINVYGVFVTEKTDSSNLQLDEVGDSLSVYIFCHPYGDIFSKDYKKMTKTNEHTESVSQHTQSSYKRGLASGKEVRKEIVLAWMPSKSIKKLSEEVANQCYMRIGQTPWIGEEEEWAGWNMHLIKRDTNRVYERNVVDTYQDIQEPGSNSIRIGHYEYDGAHNFFDFNFQYIIERSNRIKNGVFLYLLKTIFFSLSLEPKKDIDEMREKDPNGWGGELNTAYNDNGDDWNKVLAVICPRHHFTELLVRYITKILPYSLSKRILLVNMMYANRKNGSLTPPSVLWQIKEKLAVIRNHIAYPNTAKLSAPKDILIFDNIIESGKTRKILEHILRTDKEEGYKSGGEAVKTLTIVDSYRLPHNNPDVKHHRAYWRFDFPRMGRNQACPLCSSLMKAAELRNEASQNESDDRACGFLNGKEIKNCIDRWEQNWRCVPSLERVSGHGIEEDIISHPINAKDIDINFAPVLKTYIGLAVYAAEMRSIHLDESIIESIIKQIKNKTAGTETNKLITLVIASNLLLYGEFTSLEFHIKILCELILAASQLEESNYSALAALALLANETNLERAVLKCLDDGNKDVMFRNNDLNIVFSHAAKASGVLYLELPPKITYPFDNQSRKASYERLHYELYNEASAIHESNLRKIIYETIPSEKEPFSNVFHGARSSLRMIQTSLIHIGSEEYAEDSIQNCGGDEKLIGEMEVLYDSISRLFQIAQKDIRSAIGEFERGVKYKAEEVFNVLLVAHNGLFIAYKTGLPQERQKYNLYERIIEIIRNNNKTHKIMSQVGRSAVIELDFSPLIIDELNNMPNVWYYWNYYIERELGFLLHNVKHSTGDLVWTSRNRPAHMVVAVSFGLEFCFIRTLNISNDDGELVDRMFRRKARISKLRNRQLGVLTRALSTPSQLYQGKYELTVEMKIPVVKLSVE